MLHLTSKYAAFVWTSYGLSAVVILGLVALSLRRAAFWRKKAEALEPEAPR